MLCQAGPHLRALQIEQELQARKNRLFLGLRTRTHSSRYNAR
jgi:hypothetical protein